MAANAHVKRLLLTHIRKHMDSAGHLEQMIAEAKQHFDGEVAIAEDLIEINI